MSTRGKLISWSVVLLLVGGVAGVFYVQNSEVQAVLGLNLGVKAWRLSQPVPVAGLLVGGLLGGFLLGWSGGAMRACGLARRVRQLEASDAGRQVRGEDGW